MNQTLQDLKPSQDVDTLLAGYFRAEMPDPWPDCAALAEAGQTRRCSKFRSLGRLALAASVVLFFLGYLTLAGFFPRPHAGAQSGSSEMGNVPPKHAQKH